MNKNKLFEFNSIKIKDHKIFCGENIINFNENITLIVGENGTGKTTIFNALKYAIDANNNALYDNEITLEYSGNTSDIIQYIDIMFISDVEILSLEQDDTAINRCLDKNDKDRFHEITKTYFKNICSYKTSEIKSYPDLDPSYMAMGTRICLAYSKLFAIRDVMQLNLPLILDSLMGPLDLLLRDGLIDFLSCNNYQKIILASPYELNSRLLESASTVYTINYENNQSKIVCGTQ